MRNFQKKFLVFILLISLILLLAEVIFIGTIGRANKIVKANAHNYQIIAEVEATLSLLRELESQQRAYVITNQEIYLFGYNDVINLIQEHLTTLKDLANDSQEKQKNIALLEPLIKQRIEIFNQNIKLNKQEGFDSVKKRISSGSGRKLMNRIEQIFMTMKEEENNLLSQQQQQLVTIENKTKLTLTIFTTIAFLFLGLIGWLIKQYIIYRDILELSWQELAIRDELTGLYNRRQLNLILQVEINRCHGKNKCFCLVLIDIDYFKKVNDNYGHPVGDKVLQWFSKLITANIRLIDYAARFGGEEIAIILPNLDRNQSLSITERIRQSLLDFPFTTYSDSEQKIIDLKVTFSAGISSYENHDNITLPDLINQADQALYQAKSSGRNQTFLFERRRNFT